MLPSLKKSIPQEFQVSQIKLYNPPRQLMNFQNQYQRKSSMMSSSRANNKIRVMAGGFKKDDTYQTSKTNKYLQQTKNLQQPNYATLSMHQPKQLFNKLNSNTNLSAQIKLIQKKIRYHKKKLQQQKKKKQQMDKVKNDPYSQDFQKIIQREMQLQGYNYNQSNQPKGFDYLTNPGKLNQQEQQPVQVQQPEPILIQQPKKYDITQKIQKLQKHYQHSLKKKFQRREMFPHYPCKRKTPKLYVTTKTNALEKFGKKPAQQEHVFRVMTKQCTPQQIYPTIPNFAIVKDSLSKNVMAYLSDFKPFIQKTKQDPDQQNTQGQNMAVQSRQASRQGKKTANQIDRA